MSKKHPKSSIFINTENLKKLKSMINSKSITANRRKLIQVLILMHEGHSDEQIAETFQWSSINRVERIRSQYLTLGLAKLVNIPDNHKRPRHITQEARQWVLSISKQKPKDVKNGPNLETWSLAKLAIYVRHNCVTAGHPCLATAVKSTIWSILHEEDPLKID